MTAVVRMFGYRLITCRHRIANLTVSRNAKCMLQNLYLPRSLSVGSSPFANDVTEKGTLITQTVFTSKGVSGRIVGKRGENIKKLLSECGLEFKIIVKDDHILVSGSDAEGVQRATEKVEMEVRRLGMLPKTEIFPAEGKVLTDEDADIHDMISRLFVGTGAKNIKRIKSETGLKFSLGFQESGQIRVSGTDAEVVKRVVEIIKQEVQTIKTNTCTIFPFFEKVFIDEDANVRNRICSLFIGKRGENITRLKSEMGPNCHLNILKEIGRILVSGTDAEVVKTAVEKVQQEVQTIKTKEFAFNEKVLTDEDVDIHTSICRLLVGKTGRNVKRMKSETGLNFVLGFQESGQIRVSGPDAEVVKRTAELVQQEVQTIKTKITERTFPFIEKVLIDDDATVGNMICKLIVGKGGENIERLKSGIGPNIHLNILSSRILVSGTDAEVVMTAVEKVQQEVQRIKAKITFPFIEKVLTDHGDANVRNRICSLFIGTGGQNIRRLISEIGPNIHLNVLKESGEIAVSGTDAEVVKRGVEKVQQEVQRLKIQMR